MESRLEEKIKKLLEKGDQKLRAASTLYQEKLYEDSISRAYYAMHHAALALLLTKNISPKTHSGLLTMFGLHFIKTKKMEKKYFDILSHARDLRENGDYEALFVASAEEARVVLSNAKRFVKKAKELLVGKKG